MARIDKYGEIEESGCPQCGNPVKTEWVVCPICRAPLIQTDKNEMTDKHLCPMCGEKAVSKEGAIWCKKLDCFVHKKCLGGFKMGGPYLDINQVPSPPYNYICPGCGEKATALNGWFCRTCNTFVHYACIKQDQGHIRDRMGNPLKAIKISRCPVCDNEI